MGAMNQRAAELQSIKLFGSPCPQKKPTHKSISRAFIAAAAFFKFITFSNQIFRHSFRGRKCLDICLQDNLKEVSPLPQRL